MNVIGRHTFVGIVIDEDDDEVTIKVPKDVTDPTGVLLSDSHGARIGDSNNHVMLAFVDNARPGEVKSYVPWEEQ